MCNLISIHVSHTANRELQVRTTLQALLCNVMIEGIAMFVILVSSGGG